MRNIIWVLAAGLLFTACKNNTSNDFMEVNEDNGQTFAGEICGRDEVERVFKQAFEANKITGVFVMFDPQLNELYISDDQQAATMYSPASTFKIVNALIALETGAVRSPEEVIPWDQVHREKPEWNQDMNMKTAFRHSAIWFFRKLSRRIGEKEMKKWLEEIQYGNTNIKGGIDRFWLSGELKITPYQQMRFMEKLYKEELPFRPEVQKAVKNLLVLEETSRYTLAGKTGLVQTTDPERGWFTGYVHKAGEAYIFSYLMEVNRPGDMENRIGVPREILSKLDLL